jgi:hypothetical protein
MDELVNSLKRLRTDDEQEEKKVREVEEEEVEEKEAEVVPQSTALVLSRPKIRSVFQYSPSPSYSLPAPLTTFPVVVYKGPPSPTLLPSPRKDPPDIEEIEEVAPCVSKENRVLRVSPSFTIELVDDDEEAVVRPLRRNGRPAVMSDDELD